MKKRAETGGVQMFSFLDAMICTLGALLVLLHAFARHGETELVRKAEAKAVEQAGEKPQVELELLQWRIEELKKMRAKTKSQLADERLRLAHVEDHERRLKSKFDKLRIAATELEKLAESGKNDRLRNQAALEAARVRLTEARSAVEEAKEKSNREANYSVVPYEGFNATHRRPIYIECREDAMILQPEGVELRPEDFAGYLGPGNPLASSLRGIREYYAQQASPDEPTNEPYPLLLVRPDGVATYYAALSALNSWGAEFGYELIGADWKLKFPDRDDQLAQLLLRIVADSRLRMRELMLATSELRSRRGGTALRASSNGGFVAEGGHHRGGGFARSRPARGGDWDSLDSDWVRGSSSGSARPGEGKGIGGSGTGDGFASRRGGPSSRTGSAYGGGDTRGGAGGGFGAGGGTGEFARGGGGRESGAGKGNSPYDHVGRAGSPYGNGTGDGRYGGRNPGRGGQGGRAVAGGRNSGRGGQGGRAVADGRNGAAGGDAASGAGQPGDPNAQASADPGQGGGNSQTGSAAGGNSSGKSSGKASAGSQFAAAGAGAGSARASGSSSASASGGSAGAGGAGSSCPTGAPSSAHPSFTSQHKPRSMAESRGRNWGLPNSGDNMTGVTRPILVQCHVDRLVIVPESRGQQPQVVHLNAEAHDKMDEFVSDVWQHMNSWGIAGRGLFWRPTLVMDVDPDATDRYAEIKALLTDSGLDVRARRPSASRTRTNTQRAPARR